MANQVTQRATIRFCGLACGAIVPLLACAAGTESEPSASKVQELLVRDLKGAPGREVRMLTVDYRAGGASLPHRHDAQVFVYVLAGRVRMQVAGAAEVTLGPGETFYEGPGDIHVVSANASQNDPARILVIMVRDKSKPLSTDVPPEGPP